MAVEVNSSAPHDPAVAVVGLSVRLPGAPDADAFWSNLLRGVESIANFTDAELRAAGATAQEIADPAFVRRGGVLADIEGFDAAFFGYSPREAAVLDPQQRLFLEVAWAALEDAGWGDRAVRRTTGVWAAAAPNRYLHDALRRLGIAALDPDELTTLLASDKDFLATRAAFHLDLGGPAMAVQSGCSSSLLAVANAWHALVGMQCDLALAGGVTVRVPQARGMRHVADGIVAPDGRCRPFDARAHGTVFSSGVGVVVLKRLADALEDGDTIRAVIRGVAVNNDGATKVGFTAPSVERQAEVIAAAHALAGIPARTIGMVEAHGTGTSLGDPIEVAALAEAFRISGARIGSCALGSVKGNVGHLEVASGIAGLVKAVLSLQHRIHPPTANFDSPNPRLELERTPFVVDREPRDWVAGTTPRRAGVSSFGIGGTNVHVVLEEAPTRPVVAGAPAPSDERQLLVLSARTETALSRATARLAAELAGGAAPDLGDVAHTLQSGRAPLEWRRTVVCRDREEASRLLATSDERSVRATRVPTHAAQVAFLFPGQGTQRPGMGAELHRREPAFARHFDRCAAELVAPLGLDLRELLFAPPSQRESAAVALRETRFAQPALFAIEYALAQLWMEHGVFPRTMLGHSVGELVAAALTQVFRPEDALALVAARGRLLQAVEPGAMVAVALAAADCERFVHDGVELAADNSPRSATLAGSVAAIARVERELDQARVAWRRLDVDRAFHSALVEPALAEFEELVRRVPRKPPERPFVSSVTGRLITAAEATDPKYWAQQLRAPVRFAAGVQTLLADPDRLLIEVGPGDVLSGFVRDAAGSTILSLGRADDSRGEHAAWLDALGQAWSQGVQVDWRARRRGFRRQRVPLPTYPFEHVCCWLDAAPSAGEPARVAAEGADPTSWCSVPSWRRVAAPARRRFARDATSCVIAAGGGDWEPLIAELRLEVGTAVPIVVARDAAELTAQLSRLAQPSPSAPRNIVVVTDRAQDVVGGEANAANAALLGACRSLVQQEPQLRLRSIDIALDAGAATTLVEPLLAELALQEGEPCVAWRGGNRWLPELVPVELPPADAFGPERDSTWLITGGFGGIGSAVARLLASRGVRRLALVSRGVHTERLRVLETAGAEVLPLVADVTDRAALAGAFAAARARFGAIHDVVHAAGVAATGLGEAGEGWWDSAAFRTKLETAEQLVVLCGDEVERLVLCSSVAALLGGIGQAGYAAGCCGLDALAGPRRAGRPRIVSIGWDAWRESGMAAAATHAGGRAELQTQLLRDGLSDAEGVELFARIVASPHAHVLVSKRPLAARLAERQSSGDVAAVASVSAARVAAILADDGSIADPIEAEVTRVWRQLLGVTATTAGTSFFEQGGNSLLATQMLARLRERFAGADLSLKALFEQPTIAALVESVRRSVRQLVSASPSAAASSATPTWREQLLRLDAHGRVERIRDRCREELAALFRRSFDRDASFDGLDRALLAAQLGTTLTRELGMPVYPAEIRRSRDLAELAHFVAAEFGRFFAVAGRNPPIALLLSAPRSGSTLLRLMLSAHPQLVSPPELFLLDHRDLRDWSEDPFAPYYRDGLVRAVMAVEGATFEEATRTVAALVARAAPTRDAYALLQSGGRLLVDKTPTYALQLATLRRAEELFDAPRYLALVRHPVAMIDSFVRNRLDRIRNLDGDPHRAAEQTWRDAATNLLAHEAALGADRLLRVRFEELVTSPRAILERVCAFLGVAFDEALLDPYAHGRMFGGPGDPGIHRRGRIDPELAEAWRGVTLPRPLEAATRAAAAAFGYELSP